MHRFAPAFAIVTACATAPPLAPYEDHRLAINDNAWTADERAALERACTNWRVWSDGALRCTVVTDGDAFARIVTGPCAPYIGRVERAQRELVVDVEIIRRTWTDSQDLVERITAALIGQAAGMALHPGAGVLSNEITTAEFTDADRAACASAGFCRGK